jgi:hypothetical protein
MNTLDLIKVALLVVVVILSFATWLLVGRASAPKVEPAEVVAGEKEEGNSDKKKEAKKEKQHVKATPAASSFGSGTVLRGLPGQICCGAGIDGAAACASDDRVMKVWETVSPFRSSAPFKLPPGVPTAMGMGRGEDGSYFVAVVTDDNEVVVVRVDSQWRCAETARFKTGGTLFTAHVSIHPERDLVITGSTETDTVVRVFSMTGTLRAAVDTKQMKTNQTAASASGRFMAQAAFTGDVKIFENVAANRSSSYESTVRAMTLGHPCGTTSLALTDDHAVTATKDGKIRLWNTHVRYAQGEDPKAIGPAFQVQGGAQVSLLALAGSRLAYFARGGEVVVMEINMDTGSMKVERTVPVPDDLLTMTFVNQGESLFLASPSEKCPVLL